MIEGFLNNLISQRIPMVNSWSKNLGVEIDKNTRKEIKTTLKTEKSGYAFLSTINRGYISYKQKRLGLTSDSRYLLGMFLRALREIKGLNLMPFFDCVSETEIIPPERITKAPIVFGEKYSIFADSTMPVNIYLEYLNTDLESIKKQIYSGAISSRRPVRVDTRQIPEATVPENLIEYVNLTVVSKPSVTVRILEGVYKTMPVLPINDRGFFSAKDKRGISNLYPNLMKPFNIKTNIKTNLSSDKTNNLFEVLPVQNISTKLLEGLLDILITDDSLPEIRNFLLETYGFSGTIGEMAKNKTAGLYDVNEYADRRIIK